MSFFMLQARRRLQITAPSIQPMYPHLGKSGMSENFLPVSLADRLLSHGAAPCDTPDPQRTVVDSGRGVKYFGKHVG